MPLWQIYHPPMTFETEASRAALAKDITEMYTSVGLPAFYVVVIYKEQPNGTIFVGGATQPGPERKKPFIRITVKNIARKLPEGENQRKMAFLNRVDKALKPHIEEKGYDWEFHVEETERLLWKINGMFPPPTASDDEKAWFAKNEAIEWSGAYKSSI